MSTKAPSIPSLLAAVITLKPAAPTTAPAALGRAVHAWLLHRIERHDPILSGHLHGMASPRPFTVSNVWGLGPARQGRVTVSPEQDCYLRITGLTPEVNAAIINALPTPGEGLTLGPAVFIAQSTTTETAVHPWAGRSDYGSLVQQHVITIGPYPSSVTLRFSSPTLFRSGGRDVPLPLPHLVFTGYLRKWNAFSPLPLPDDATRYAAEGVALSKFKLRSHFVSFEAGGKGGHVGFTGEVRFRFLVKDQYWMRVMRLLGGYAFWAGTGYRTTAGLGQTQAIRS